MGFSTIDYKINTVLARPISTHTLIHNDHSQNHDDNPSCDSNDVSDSDQQSQTIEEKSVARGGVVTPFPWKLHDMLERVDIDGFEKIVCWQPHGRSFMVHKPDEFVDEVMPVYFNQTKFASFQRQLNLYGFRRITQGRDKGAYYHECFLRGRRNLCQGMHRQKVKGTRVRRAIAPGMEPDFWSLPFMPEKNEKQLSTADLCLSQASPDPSSSSSLKIDIPESPSRRSRTNSTPPLTPTESDDLMDFHCSDDYLANALLSDDVLFFEGKPFHYLEKQSFSEREKRRRVDSVEIDPLICFI